MHHRWARRAALATVAVLVGLAGPASASLPQEADLDSLPTYSTSSDLGVKMRNAEGNAVISQIVNDDGYWADAWKREYDGKVYDEIRLKDGDNGYVPMITGEGLEDFPNEVVSHIIFNRMHQLPLYMSGAKAVSHLGKGHDSTIGADYVDTFWFLDLTALYVVYPMRTYRRHDPATNTTYLWFEKIEPDFVDAATWSSYQQKMEETKSKVSLRWPPFNSVNEVETLYGIFIVSPGETRESRVTFVSKLAFGDDAGWLAKFGSQLPGVIKAGLRSGFVASVAIASDEKKRREKSGG